MVDAADVPSRDLGDIGVSNEVFESISVICTKKVAGVVAMETTEGLVDSLSKVWGRSDAPKGVKVTTGDEDVTVDMTVILEEGYSIPKVTGIIQREVKMIIEEMTGHAVKAVNILVADLQPGNSAPLLMPADEIEEPRKITTGAYPAES